MSSSISQRQVMTTELRHLVRDVITLRQAQLVDVIGEEHYRPYAQCPACRHQLSEAELLQGFTDDVTDYSTSCPRCQTRFAPQLRWITASGATGEIPFYCAAQSLAQLTTELALYQPTKLFSSHPALFRSIVFHFGNLHKGFEAAGLEYPHEGDPLRDAIVPFLSELPDTYIARASGIPVSRIRSWRMELRLPAFSRRQLADEIDNS